MRGEIMDINEIISEFQLVNTRIFKAEITNHLVDLPPFSELNCSLNLGNPDLSIEEKEDHLCATLQLALDYYAVHKDNNDDSFKISIAVEGLFVYNEKNKEKFTQMLMLNGNTALYSIIRSYVMTLSSLSLASGKIILPMINFAKIIESEEN